ncbi:MAG: TonB-dependent receptor, partial [Pyrinomonadaceae bacterium]
MTRGSYRSIVFAVVVTLLPLGYQVPTRGQISTAQVKGSVKDENGRVIQGATVTVTNTATNIGFGVTTNETGQYLITNLPPGRYELRAASQNFTTSIGNGLQLAVGQSATLDVVLKVGTLEETVSISAEESATDRTKTEFSQVIDEKQIRNLPTINRQFIDFALLTPFVTRGRAVTGGAQGPLQEDVTKLSFAGLSEQHSNLFLLDGADHSISLSGFQHLTPSPEAVQEFRIIDNSYGAEYGHALGGVVSIVTKSGTKDLHGSAYDFVKNDALNAKSILAASGTNVLRQQQFGFTLGGPIIKERTFFFGNYEGQRKTESPISTSFLLNNLRAVNAVKSFYHLSAENLGVRRSEDYDQFFFRVDHQLTTSNRGVARYNFVDQRNGNAPGAPGNLGAPSSFRNNLVRDQSLVLSLFSTESSNTTNEALFQYSHRNFRYDSVSGEPNLEISNVLELGRNIGPADDYIENRLEFSDTIKHQLGKHYLLFGGDFSRITDKITWPLAVNGYLVFSPASFFGAPPFGSPTPFLFVFSVPRAILSQQAPAARSTDWKNSLFPNPAFEAAAEIPYAHNTSDFFVQDQWRATKNLGLNLGMRYFVETRGGFDVKSDLNNFDPRVGFAYSPGNKVSIRGGMGIYHSILSWSNSIPGDTSYVGSAANDLNLLLGPGSAREFTGTTSLGVSLSPIPIPQFTAPAAFTFVTQGIYPSNIPLLPNVFGHSVRDFPNPYSVQGSLQGEYRIGRKLVLTAGYLGVHALKMMTVRQVNSRIIGKLPNGKTQFAPLDQRFGIYHIEFPGNTTIYHGGSLAVASRFGRNVSLSANYTFSKTIDLVNSGSNLSFKDAPDDQSNLSLNRG